MPGMPGHLILVVDLRSDGCSSPVSPAWDAFRPLSLDLIVLFGSRWVIS
jgi:hypothetical protein